MLVFWLLALLVCSAVSDCGAISDPAFTRYIVENYHNNTNLYQARQVC